MVNIQNPKFSSETDIDCEVEHPELGWIPFTLGASDTSDFSNEVREALKGQEIASRTFLPHNIQREEAQLRLNDWYAQQLQTSTGDVSPAEQQTWVIKEAAALAFIGGDCSDSQLAMLTAEATARGILVDELSSIIAEKAESYRETIGILSAQKAKMASEILSATDEAIDIALVEERLNAVFAEAPS